MKNFLDQTGQKIKFKVRSMQMGECSGATDFSVCDMIVLSCLVPREYSALAVRMELYRAADMSIRSIRAHRTDACGGYDAFEVPLMLSRTCAPRKSGELTYTFSIKTKCGLVWASDAGGVTHERVCAHFGRILVYDSSRDCVQKHLS